MSEEKKKSPAKIQIWNPKRFQIIEELGAGGFGQVYLAKDVEHKSQKVALKKLYKKKTKDFHATSLKQLLTEVDLLRQLKPHCHKYFVCIEDVFEDTHHYYITTEFIEGYISLRDAEIAEMAKTNGPAIKNIIVNLMDGLKLLHSLGMAHNDIKPDNILIDPTTGAAKFLDLGLGCRNGGCRRFQLTGTFEYIDPAMFLMGIDAKNPTSLKILQLADVWSLAVTIWEFVNHGVQYFEAWVELNDDAFFETNETEEEEYIEFAKMTEQYEYPETNFKQLTEQNLLCEQYLKLIRAPSLIPLFVRRKL